MTATPKSTLESPKSYSSSVHPAGSFDITFPALEDPTQDQEAFDVTIRGKKHRLRIHDYDALYNEPGLYEALVYDKLRCRSPQRVVELLTTVLTDWPRDPADLRVLDLGAGNGIVAEELRRIGVPYILGLDLLPEAAKAARRDRPDAYNDYLVADLTDLSRDDATKLREAKLNLLITVAALGFGDIPPRAFAQGVNMVCNNGWLAMTIKEDFLHPSDDDSGFAKLVQMMISERIIEMEAHMRYCHRRSVTGENLFYVAAIARKLSDIPEEMIRRAEASSVTIETNAEAAGHVSTILGHE